MANNCLHKSVKQPTLEQYRKLRHYLFQGIHYNLNKRKNLVYKSQRHTVQNFKKSNPKATYKIPLIFSDLKFGTPLFEISCNNPICQICLFCLHSKPSLESFMNNIDYFVTYNVKQFFHQFVL